MADDSATQISGEIEKRLAQAFELDHLEVINESHRHNVPSNSETHFKLVMVSEEFAELSRIKRHRAVNSLLQDLLAGSVHAMAIHPYTTTEWRKRFGAAPLSPPCFGGESLGAESKPASGD